MQTLSGNEAAVLARQEDKARGDLARLTRPAHRRAAELVLGVRLHRRRDQRRPDGAGADGVAADAVAELQVREAAREGDDGALGGGVVEQVRAADVGVDGGVVDDRVAGVHVLEAVFCHVEVGVDVGVEGEVPLVSVRGGGKLANSYFKFLFLAIE